MTVSRRAQTIQRAAIPFVGRCWPGDIPAGNFSAKIPSATSWLKRAPQSVSSTIARLSQPSVSMGSFLGEETGGLNDSPLEESRIRTLRPFSDQCLPELVEPCAEAAWRAGGELSPWRGQ